MRAFRWRSFAAGLSSHSRQSPTNSSPEWGRGAKVLVPWSPNSGRNRWVKSGLLCGVCCSGWPPFHQPLVRCPLTRRRQRLCSTQVVKNSLNKALYNAMYDSQNLHGRSTEVLNLIHATHHTTNKTHNKTQLSGSAASSSPPPSSTSPPATVVSSNSWLELFRNEYIVV